MRGKLQFLFVVVAGSYVLLLALHLLLRVFVKDATWYLAFVNQFTPFYFLPLIVLLPLALAFRTRRVALQLLVLVAIGAAAYGPRFIPRATAASDGDSLRVLTFNVWGDNQRLEDVEQWIREQNADVVLLQEFSAEMLTIANTSLRDIYRYQSDISMWGNLTLSRYPITNEEMLDMQGDGALTQHRMTLEVDGQSITIYNIHFAMPARETSRFNSPINFSLLNLSLAFDPAWRDTQIHNFIDVLESETGPYIAAGDFNMSDQSAIYSELAAVASDSFAEVGVGLGQSWPNPIIDDLRFLPPLVRIDYIWHSDEFQAVSAQQGPVLGSDHLPLIATLELVE